MSLGILHKFEQTGKMRNKKRIKPYLKKIEKFWLKHPELRFTQVLVNLDIIPNFPGMWYYKEDELESSNNHSLQGKKGKHTLWFSGDKPEDNSALPLNDTSGTSCANCGQLPEYHELNPCKEFKSSDKEGK